MTLFILAFFAGILTVLAPCVLPLLPVIIGSSAAQKNTKKIVIITASLGISVFVFTLLLKASAALIDIPPMVWTGISGGIILALGLVTLFPATWDKIALKFNLSRSSDNALASSKEKGGYLGSILTGAALGPVFSSCSPTYALILATILPVSLLKGTVYLTAYCLGLTTIMLLVGIFGQAIIRKLRWASNPNGWFKKILGIIFIIVGFSIIFGLEKKVETYLVEKQYFDITKIEIGFLQNK